MPAFLAPVFRNWSQPLGPMPAGVRAGLMWLALLLRLYAGGLTGFVFSLLGLRDLGLISTPGFVPYGWDKLFAGNVTYGMGADFFRGFGLPFPELTALLIGALELFGGLALIIGLFTRLFALLLAGNMFVAAILVGTNVEQTLFVVCALLVWLGGGMLSADQLLDRRMAAARRPTPIVSR